MTDLDSIFKSRHITSPTKVRLVKAMVFPVVRYGCESWTVRKAERRRMDAFEPWPSKLINEPLFQNKYFLNIYSVCVSEVEKVIFFLKMLYKKYYK